MHRFIVVALFFTLAAVYYYNASNETGPDISTELLAGLLGAVMAFYFQKEASKKR